VSFFYLDSSALVKRYLPEVGSTWINALTDPNSGHTILVSALTRVEAAAAIAARQRAGTITLQERNAAIALLLLHYHTEYRPVLVDAIVIDRAVGLTQTYRLRGYDAIQLASALEVNTRYHAAGLAGITFLAADSDLLAAAQHEGLAIDDPNQHP
jgi:hypothetical protein